MPPTMPIVTLPKCRPARRPICSLLMTAKEELTTKTGKPYFRVGFRDAGREVSFPIWDDSPWAVDCRDRWTPGVFYKLRAVYRETNFGPQLEIRKIREVVDADAADGFDPDMLPAAVAVRSRGRCSTNCWRSSREQIDDAAAAAAGRIDPDGQPRGSCSTCPAARRNHHAFVGGLLEHTLSVTRTCVFLADKYAEYYPDMKPPLDKGLVVAGGILHDIGKLREMDQRPEGTLLHGRRRR